MITRRVIVGPIVLAVSLLAGSGYAQPVTSVSDQSPAQAELQALRDDLDALREELNAANFRPATQLVTRAPSGAWLPGVYGGVEAMALQAYTKSNTALTINNGPSRQEIPFDYGFDFAPRFFAGFTASSGTGLRASYFTFDDESDTVSFSDTTAGVPSASSPLLTPAITFNGQTIATWQSLAMRTLDLELTQQYRLGRLLGTASAGGRYAYYERYSRVNLFDPGPVLNTSVWQRSQFDAFGPSIANSFLLPINGTVQGFSLYCDARTSIVFGESEDIVAPGGVSRTNSEGAFWISELRVGAQYTRGGIFLRALVETQYWDDTGIPLFQANSSIPGTSDVGLLGFNLSAGVNY